MKYSYEEMKRFELKKWEYSPQSRSTVFQSKPFPAMRYQFSDGIWKDSNAKTDGIARVLIAGDLMCQERLIVSKKTGPEQYNFDSSLNRLEKILKSSDLTVGNLETVVDPQAPYPNEKLFIGKYVNRNCPPEFLQTLRNVGFDLLTTANNHMLDTGMQGVYSTCRMLDSYGFMHTGSYIDPEEPHYVLVEVKGIKLGILTYGFFTNFKASEYISEEGIEKTLGIFSDKRFLRDIADVKTAGAEYVICCMHWGTELVHTVNDKQKKWGQFLADHGVDYIVGSHPHVLQPYDIITASDGRRVPVAYSAGNLLSHFKQVPRKSSIILQLDFTRNVDGTINVKDSYLPCYTFSSFDKREYVVAPLTDKKYLYAKTNMIVEEQKAFIARIIGNKLPLSHSYDESKKTVDEKAPEESVLSKSKTVAPTLNKVIKKEVTAEKEPEYETNFPIKNPTSVQEKLLKEYRLSDEFRRAYGEHVFKHYRNGEGIKAAVRVLQRIKNTEKVDIDANRELIIDMLYTRNVLGFHHWEYFAYDLGRLSIRERLEFMPQAYNVTYYRKLNTNKDGIDVLNNKHRSYQRLKHFYKRKVLYIKDDSNKEEFVKFNDEFSRFIVKPTNLSCGSGVEIVDSSKFSSAEDAFEFYREKMPYLCEELLVSDESMSAFHPSSVNSVRVFTLVKAGVPEIFCTWFKVGRGGAVIDNASAGGLAAAIDKETGIISSDARDEDGHGFSTHPDSGIAFKGYQIKAWDNLLETCKQLALEIPGVNLIGWDMALLKSGEWAVIEGNAYGMINILQLGTQKGLRKEFEKAIEWHKYQAK